MSSVARRRSVGRAVTGAMMAGLLALVPCAPALAATITPSATLTVSGAGASTDPLGVGTVALFSGGARTGAPATGTGAGSTVDGQFEAPSTRDTTDTTPTYYYLMSNVSKGVYWSGPRDGNGVIMVKYPFLSSPVYNPVTAGQWALVSYDRYLQYGDKAAYRDFMRQAVWLRSALDSRGRLPFRWSYGARDLDAPWYSAMAQGMAISVFCRVYAKTKDPAWLAAARRAYQPMITATWNGGVGYPKGTDLWLEEYPESPPSHVLNGWIFGIFGIYDLVRVTGLPGPKSALQRTTHTLATHIRGYEHNGSILYQLRGVNYAYDYENLHLDQLRSLAGLRWIPDAGVFRTTADRWELHFRSYPLPTISWNRAAYSALYGQRVTVSGSIRPIYRWCKMQFSRVDGGVKTVLGEKTVYPSGTTGSFYFVTRGLSRSTRIVAEILGDAATARSVPVYVR